MRSQTSKFTNARLVRIIRLDIPVMAVPARDICTSRPVDFRNRLKLLNKFELSIPSCSLI